MSTALLDHPTTETTIPADTYVCGECHAYDEGCTPNVCHGFDTD